MAPVLPYSSKSPEFAEDVAHCVEVYRALGLETASNAASDIADTRNLDAGQRLTLVTAIQRKLITEGL